MSRGIGEFTPIQENIPEFLAVIIALLTQLGDAWFLITLLALLYWTNEAKQDDVLLVGGILACGVGLYRGLKHLFGFPRPDQPLLDPELLPWGIQTLYELTAHASGYGFPSGHATMTTIVYFGLATVLTIGTRRVRFIGAGAIVSTVGFSRIALGVHYFVDIVAGVSVGLLLLYVSFRILDQVTHEKGTAVLAVAVLLNGFYVYTSDAHIEAVLVLGISLGLFGGWQLILLARDLVDVDRPSEAARPAAVRVALTVTALAPLVFALETFPILSGEPYPLAGALGLGTAVVIIVPVARYSARARRVFAGVSFWTRTFVFGLSLLLRPSTWRRAVRQFRQFWYRLRD